MAADRPRSRRPSIDLRLDTAAHAAYAPVPATPLSAAVHVEHSDRHLHVGVCVQQDPAVDAACLVAAATEKVHHSHHHHHHHEDSAKSTKTDLLEESLASQHISLNEIPGETGSPDNKQAMRVSSAIPLSSWVIVAVEFCERFAFYGASLVFQLYLTQQLKMDQNSATALNTFFSFFAYLTSALGGIVADSWMGRYSTIMIAIVVYMVGLIILTVSALPQFLGGSFPLSGFIVGIILIAIGTGVIKSNVSAMAAEQVTLRTPEDASLEEKQVEQKVIERIFRYFYWSINIGALLGMGICSTLHHLDDGTAFWLSFLTPTVVFSICLILFGAAKRIYSVSPPSGSVIPEFFRVIGHARRTHRESHHQLDHEKLHSLDYAKVTVAARVYNTVAAPEELKNVSGWWAGKWSDEFVDDVKKTLRAVRIFPFFILYWCLYGQMQTNFISQGVTMAAPGWLTADQLNLVDPLFLVILIPLFDHLVYPLLEKRGIVLGPIRRITIGFAVCTVGFVYVTVLQYFIYTSPPYYNMPNNNQNEISIWWQIPPYAIIAISEIFASVTGLEYAFSQAPAKLKSVIMALFLLTTCGGSLLGMIIAPFCLDPNMLIVYAVLTGCLAILTVIFGYLFRHEDAAILKTMQDKYGDRRPSSVASQQQQAEPESHPIKLKRLPSGIDEELDLAVLTPVSERRVPSSFSS